MAKLIPIILPKEILNEPRRQSEVRFFNACKGLPDNWTVLYSVRWYAYSQGEADFVVISPDTGFIVIEVKGGRIGRDENGWYSIDRDGIKNPIPDPGLQATKCKNKLIRILQESSCFADRFIPARHMVCFPNVSNDDVKDIKLPDLPRSAQLLSDDLRHLERAILRFAKREYNNYVRPLSIEDCQKISDILKPIFEMGSNEVCEDTTQDNDDDLTQNEDIPEPKPIPITSALHQHKYAMYIVRETCVSKGYTLYQCECGEEYKENFTPEKEHTFEKTETQEPTCTDSGYDEYTCSVCGEKNRHNIIAKGHSFSGWTEHKHSTCYENGNEIRECLVCGTTETRSLWKKPHTFGEWKVQRAPTCTKRGKEIKRCLVCGTIESRTLWEKGHTWGEWTIQKNPTCAEFGEKTITCSVCGTIEKGTIRKTEHTFGEWKEHKPAPTCTEGGNEIRECLNCGFSEIRRVAKKEHAFGEWTIQRSPTCTEQGEEIRQCSCCGATEYRALDPVGHKWDQTFEQKDKTKIPVCSRCGEEKVDSVIFTLEYHKRQAVIATLIAILFVSLLIGSILLGFFVIACILSPASCIAIVLSMAFISSYSEEKRKCNPLKNKVYPQKDKKEHGHLFYLSWLACGFVLALIASIVTGYLNFVQKIELFGIIWFVLFLPMLWCAAMIYAYIRDEILKK